MGKVVAAGMRRRSGRLGQRELLLEQAKRGFRVHRLAEQEALNVFAAHLLQQGERCIRDDMPYAGDCMYRGDHGRMCAVGVLIPDDEYYEELEYLAADDEEIVRICDCSPNDGPFLKQLQDLHDKVDPQGWRPALLVFAYVHQLDQGVAMGGLMDGPDMMPTPQA